MLKYMPVIAMLGYVSYTDLKDRIVPNKIVLILLLYSFFIIEDYKQSIVMGLFVFIAQLAMAVITNGGIGGGDIKLVSVVAFMMGYDIALIALPLAIMMIITMIYCIIAKKGIKYSVPFIPYVFISYIMVVIYKNVFVIC